MIFLSPMRLLTMGALCVTLVATPAMANDPMVEGARLCTQQFPYQEQMHGIPSHLLAAISSTESGRWHKQLGLALPWPWTINVEGKGYYFDTKAEAIAQTAALLRQGKRSIDVGCMQVNLKHHPKAFRTLEEAFDPATNVAYGSKFLRANYNDLHDWVKATAAYHSRTTQRGKPYVALIEKSWNRIVAKVQQARARQGADTAMPSGPNFKTAALMPDTPVRTPNIIKTVSSSNSVVSGKKMNPIASTRNVRVISVSEQQRPKQEVLVIRTSQQTPAVKVADARNAEMMVQQPQGDTIRAVNIDSGVGSANSANSNSAKFVFAN